MCVRAAAAIDTYVPGLVVHTEGAAAARDTMIQVSKRNDGQRLIGVTTMCHCVLSCEAA